jgi:hypothetical protein
MNYLTADEDLLDRLRGIVEPVEIRDPEGKLLGVYTPHVTPEVRALYEKARKLFDPEEIKRRKTAEHGQGKTTAEVLEYLKSLETQG